jgi:hypothetical protein
MHLADHIEDAAGWHTQRRFPIGYDELPPPE